MEASLIPDHYNMNVGGNFCGKLFKKGTHHIGVDRWR
jgi:hypothetical protein